MAVVAGKKELEAKFSSTIRELGGDERTKAAILGVAQQMRELKGREEIVFDMPTPDEKIRRQVTLIPASKTVVVDLMVRTEGSPSIPESRGLERPVGRHVLHQVQGVEIYTEDDTILFRGENDDAIWVEIQGARVRSWSGRIPR